MNKSILEYIEEAELDLSSDDIEAGDDFVLELAEDVALETYVIDSWDDCVLIEADAGALDLLEESGVKFASVITEAEYQGCIQWMQVQFNCVCHGRVSEGISPLA